MDDEQDKSGEVGKAADTDDEQGESLAVAALAYAVASVAPKLEHAKAQMTRLHERGPVPQGEHFPEPLGFPELMELGQRVGFPAPLAPAQEKASAPV